MSMLLALVGLAHGLVLSRFPHGDGHHDTIRCHAESNGPHDSLASMVEDFVLADTIWCPQPVAGANCTDGASRMLYRLVTLSCQSADTDCVATIDCADIIFERVWLCLGLSLVAIAGLVVGVRCATDRVRDKVN